MFFRRPVVIAVALAALLGSVAAALLASRPADLRADPSGSPSAASLAYPTASSASPTASSPMAPTATGTAPSLEAGPLGPWSVQLSWSLPIGTARVEILRNGRLLDVIVSQSVASAGYTDRLLWPGSSYTYNVQAFSDTGALVADLGARTVTPLQSLAFPRLYSPTSFWNQAIRADPTIDAHSAAIVAAALVPYSARASLSNSNDWGIALSYSDGLSKRYRIGCSLYACDLAVSSRIPRYARPSAGSDHHLAVIDPEAGTELDAWLASYDPARDAWSAGARFLLDPGGRGAACSVGQHCLGGVASGFAIMGGAVRPEEIAQGHIDHALAVTTPYTRRGFIACPATSTDGAHDDPAAIPEGARIQLDPAFKVDAQPWPRWVKVIATALQTYGAYVSDTGGSLAIRAESNLDRMYDAWKLAGVSGISPSLASLPWSRFRVLALHTC